MCLDHFAHLGGAGETRQSGMAPPESWLGHEQRRRRQLTSNRANRAVALICISQAGGTPPISGGRAGPPARRRRAPTARGSGRLCGRAHSRAAPNLARGCAPGARSRSATGRAWKPGGPGRLLEGKAEADAGHASLVRADRSIRSRSRIAHVHLDRLDQLELLRALAQQLAHRAVEPEHLVAVLAVALDRIGGGHATVGAAMTALRA